VLTELQLIREHGSAALTPEQLVVVSTYSWRSSLCSQHIPAQYLGSLKHNRIDIDNGCAALSTAHAAIGAALAPQAAQAITLPSQEFTGECKAAAVLAQAQSHSVSHACASWRI
jgi:hypothetical protein